MYNFAQTLKAMSMNDELKKAPTYNFTPDFQRVFV